MPGPRYPNGYARVFHQISDKLISERPGYMTVRLNMNLSYARSQFNYFRQSWLRQYEFFNKNKSYEQADRALDVHNRLMAYTITIVEDKLVFKSKEIEEDIEIETSSQAPQFFQHSTPNRHNALPSKKSLKENVAKLEENFNEYVKDGLKEADRTARELFGKHEQIINDNPPANPPVDIYSLPEDKKAFYLAMGRLPASIEELDEFLR